ncbi:MAG TPA: ABC transporter ATP-binding protein [Streptosporangiaceae bacterium]
MLDADFEVDRREFTVRAAVSVAPGERLALFGPSGAGKTTILEAIAGLVPPRRGRITLNERVLTQTAAPARRPAEGAAVGSAAAPGRRTRPGLAVPPWQRRVGLLRQDPGLFPHLSVRANLGYAPTADSSALAGLADLLEIGDLLPAMPARLSGGQAHRVALGRLLMADCDALLLDEPYSGLDAALRRALTALVLRLVEDRGLPTIMVAHELPDAQAFASRLAVIDRGVLLQTGTPHEVVLRPASRRVAELVGYLGFVPASAAESAEAGPAPGAGVIAVHPDRVIPGVHPGRGVVLAGPMTACRPAGAGWEVDLQVGPATVVARLADPPAPADGRLVLTALDPPRFGPTGTALPPPGRPLRPASPAR